MIPKRLIRTAPPDTTAEQDRLWDVAITAHPDWEHVDLRNGYFYGIDPKKYPLTSGYWRDTESGAQWADLIRFEELWWRGGVYIDSDVEILRPFDSLLGLPAFAGWEDEQHVCIAVLGFPPGHPILQHAIELAIRYRHDGTWTAGMGAFNEALSHGDITLFPPPMFYPWSWRDQQPGDWRERNPWSMTAHYWAHSWRKTA